MDIEQLRELCLSFPGTSEDVKWGDNLCFCVMDKMFLITGLDQQPVPASFKVTEEQFEELSTRSGFMQAPYMARNMWVRTSDIGNMSRKEWQRYARQSYDLVKAKLPKKLQAELTKD